MLVLSRKIGQEIYVSGPALIKVLSRRGDRVRYGIVAKPSTRAVRTELLDHDERKKLGLPTDERHDA